MSEPDIDAPPEAPTEWSDHSTGLFVCAEDSTGDLLQVSRDLGTLMANLMEGKRFILSVLASRADKANVRSLAEGGLKGTLNAPLASTINLGVLRQKLAPLIEMDVLSADVLEDLIQVKDYKLNRTAYNRLARHQNPEVVAAAQAAEEMVPQGRSLRIEVLR